MRKLLQFDLVNIFQVMNFASRYLFYMFMTPFVALFSSWEPAKLTAMILVTLAESFIVLVKSLTLGPF